MSLEDYSVTKESISIGFYRVLFLAHHLDDKNFNIDTACWWSERHHITTTQENNIADFGKRVLVVPRRSPDESTYQL